MGRSQGKGLLIGLGLVAVVATATTASAFLRDDSPTHFDQEAAALREQLADARDPEIIAALQEKLRIAESSQRAERDANAAKVDPVALRQKLEALQREIAAVPEARLEKPGVPAGEGTIIEGLQPPLPSASFLGAKGNVWMSNEPVGNRTMVWAGADGQDPERGVVLVTFEGPRFERMYRADTKHGGFRVESAEGRVLLLRAADGTTIQFDLDSRTFR